MFVNLMDKLKNNIPSQMYHQIDWNHHYVTASAGFTAVCMEHNFDYIYHIRNHYESWRLKEIKKNPMHWNFRLYVEAMSHLKHFKRLKSGQYLERLIKINQEMQGIFLSFSIINMFIEYLLLS